jgi:hypothetical protein
LAYGKTGKAKEERVMNNRQTGEIVYDDAVVIKIMFRLAPPGIRCVFPRKSLLPLSNQRDLSLI